MIRIFRNLWSKNSALRSLVSVVSRGFIFLCNGFFGFFSLSPLKERKTISLFKRCQLSAQQLKECRWPLVVGWCSWHATCSPLVHIWKTRINHFYRGPAPWGIMQRRTRNGYVVIKYVNTNHWGKRVLMTTFSVLVFSNFSGAQESIPKNRFRQPM